MTPRSRHLGKHPRWGDTGAVLWRVYWKDQGKTGRKGLALLLGHTHSLSAATSGLGVLTTHTDAPIVTQTPVVPDLLEALKVVTELSVDLV